MNRLSCYIRLTVCALTLTGCNGKHRLLHILPPAFVYTIIEQGDSIYYSTPSGEIFAFSSQTPALPHTRLGLQHFRPVRGLGFTTDGNFFAASYETGIHRVLSDTLIPLPKMARSAWAMKIDGFNRIWLAGRQGVFKQRGDTLIRITDLHEAYAIDFLKGKLVAGHRSGVTLYDTATGVADTTFCKGIICWTVAAFDSLLVIGGVETCAIMSATSTIHVRLGPKNNIPWSIARSHEGDIFLGTQKGLLCIPSGTQKARCIGFRGKCIKSVFVDRSGRLWVGRYFKG